MTVRDPPYIRGVLSQMGNHFFIKTNGSTHVRLEIATAASAAAKTFVGREVLLHGYKQGRLFIVTTIGSSFGARLTPESHSD